MGIKKISFKNSVCGGRIYKKLLNAASCLLISTLLLSGCDEVQIFKTGEKEPDCPPVDALDMEADTFYVKEGTKFYKVLAPNGSASSPAETVDGSRVMGITPSLRESFPTHYKEEIVAYTTQKLEGLEDISLERMKNLGYSIGAFNGKWNPADNSIEFDATECTFRKDCSFYEVTEELESAQIKITEINGEPLTLQNIDINAGVIVGLNKDEDYTFSLYSGTYYHKIVIKADCQMLSGYELFHYGKEYMSPTQNGYMEFNTPADLKDGYYIINGQGMFKYLSVQKGESEPSNMNVPYYASEKERLAAYSRQYSINIPNTTTNVAIDVVYGDDNLLSTPQGLVFSPDGTRYNMELDEENNKLSLVLSEAMPGMWTINVIPASLNITDINVTDSSDLQELTKENYHISLQKDKTNAVIRCRYELLNDEEADEQINGSIVTPGGDTVIMVNETEDDPVTKEKIHSIVGYLPFAQAGDYEVAINHYPTVSEIEEPEITENAKTEIDVIKVEE